ncbi:MAG: Transglutaminase-like superfamily domain protein, partial [Myxococcaceae bacterium]|nr:Transglutaminase-like superfamily domain protein [Myxococcaceae bacterium]
MIASQRTRTRLLLRDGAALSAFGSVALSGAVPSWALLAFAIAFAISLTNRRPLAGRTGWSVAVLLLAALLIFGSVFRGGLDLVIAAVSFAALVTAHRLLSEPTPSTDHQVH